MWCVCVLGSGLWSRFVIVKACSGGKVPYSHPIQDYPSSASKEQVNTLTL